MKQINEPVKNAVTFSPWTASLKQQKYSDAYLWMIIGQIFQGLNNVAFVNNSSDRTLNIISDWLTVNSQVLIWQMWDRGFVVLDFDGEHEPHIVTDRVRVDTNGKVTGYRYVYYSTTYRFARRSSFDIIKDNLTFIDKIKNGDEYLTTTLGAFGILCGKTMPINAADKDNFLKRLRRTVGIEQEKVQFEIFNSEVDFKQVDFHMKDLALEEKLQNEFKTIAGYFNVPYDLLPVSGQSTYANQLQAIRTFYSNCISPLAEQILDIGRYLVVHSDINVPARLLSFRIDNVPELGDDRTADIEYKQKVAAFCATVLENNLPVDLSGYYKQLEALNE